MSNRLRFWNVTSDVAEVRLNKKVLLRERKRHTDRSVARSDGGGGAGYLRWGTPRQCTPHQCTPQLGPMGGTPWPGLMGVVPKVEYPPGQVWWEVPKVGYPPPIRVPPSQVWYGGTWGGIPLVGVPPSQVWQGVPEVGYPPAGPGRGTPPHLDLAGVPPLWVWTDRIITGQTRVKT